MCILSHSREMAAGRVSPEADFSWLGDNFFEDDVSSLLSVGRGVMESMDKNAENFDVANILKELYLFDDGVMAEWIGDEVPAVKKKKSKAMSYVTSRFGNKLTSDFEFKTMSKGYCRKAQYEQCTISSPGVIGERSKATQCLKIYLNVMMEKC